ncbi:MAG: divergent PAP2 family protein [Chloroherpetonaceae bacterium]
MKWIYIFTPFSAWAVAGGLKFLINSIKSKTLAFHQIGYGGMPSSHSAIVSSVVAMTAFREGIESSVFVLALTLAFVVMMDAMDLRRKIGRHAERLNHLAPDLPKLRERIGHSPIEVFAGALTGTLTATFIHLIAS